MKKIIVALDTPTDTAALRLLDRIGGLVDIVKVGPGLFYRYGQRFIDRLSRRGKRIFLDLKLYDIPNTVEHAVRLLGECGVYALTLHLSGGPEMIARAAAVRRRPLLWGVSVLTSFDDAAVARLGIPGGTAAQVGRLARMGMAHSIDGIVLSAHELRRVAVLRARARKRIVLVVPGIRPAIPANEPRPVDDQRRVAAPGAACRAGADFLVVGRPVIESADPRAMLRGLYADIRRG